MTEEPHDGKTFFYHVEQDEGGCESENEEEKKVDILKYLPVTELSHWLFWFATAQKYNYNPKKEIYQILFTILSSFIHSPFYQ